MTTATLRAENDLTVSPPRHGWYPSPKARRCYHRVISGVERGGELRFLTLTSSHESPYSCQRSFRTLYMRLKRRGLLQGYIKVPERSKDGKQHLHVLFRGKYIEQAMISTWWQEIHHAKIVDIRLVRSRRTPSRLASYMAKYMSKGDIFRYSWNWGWVWKGFVKDWTNLKLLWHNYPGSDVCHHFHSVLNAWRAMLTGDYWPDYELLNSS